MIDELKKKIIENLIAILSDKNLKEIKKLGNIKVGSLSMGADVMGRGFDSLGVSLFMDCPKLQGTAETLNYCVCISAALHPESDDKFEIENFFVQEQVGISLGIPIHGNPIKNDEQVLLVLQMFNNELQNLVPEDIKSNGSTPQIR